MVGSDGTLVRDNGATSASNTSAGDYEVIFDQDVTNCAYEATAGSTDSSSPPLAVAQVGQLSGNPDGVVVTTFGAADNGSGYSWGAYTNEPFHLAVFC